MKRILSFLTIFAFLNLSFLNGCQAPSTQKHQLTSRPSNSVSRDVSSIQGLRSCYRMLSEVIFGKKFIEAAETFDQEALYYEGPRIIPTWGMELELSFPKDMDQEKVAKSLAEYFEKQGKLDVNLEKNKAWNRGQFDYVISYRENGETRKWGVPYEASTWDEARGINKAVEITTPVMAPDESYSEFTDLITYLRQMGLSEARNIGGVHIHLGTKYMQVKDLTRIFEGMQRAYPELIKYFEPDQGRQYIGAGPLTIGLKKLKEIENPNLFLKDFKNREIYFNEGPVRFNFDHKTIELRLFNSSLSAEELIFNKEFTTKFLMKILEDDDFYNSLDQMTYQEIFQSLDLNL